MKLPLRIIGKWTGITVFCGAHSFIWGYLVNGEIITMIGGLATLIVMFSVIDSHPRYRARRAANALFARAMDIGIKIRLYFAAYILVIGATDYFNTLQLPFLARLPQTCELWIGMAANYASSWLTGINLGLQRRNPDTTYEMLTSHYLATYLTTIFTGLAHTIILAVICGLVYAVLRLSKKA